MKTVWVLGRIFNVFAALAMFYITVVALARWLFQF
jgi:hypothetical protein